MKLPTGTRIEPLSTAPIRAWPVPPSYRSPYSSAWLSRFQPHSPGLYSCGAVGTPKYTSRPSWSTVGASNRSRVSGSQRTARVGGVSVNESTAAISAWPYATTLCVVNTVPISSSVVTASRSRPRRAASSSRNAAGAVSASPAAVWPAAIPTPYVVPPTRKCPCAGITPSALTSAFQNTSVGSWAPAPGPDSPTKCASTDAGSIASEAKNHTGIVRLNPSRAAIMASNPGSFAVCVVIGASPGSSASDAIAIRPSSSRRASLGNGPALRF